MMMKTMFVAAVAAAVAVVAFRQVRAAGVNTADARFAAVGEIEKWAQHNYFGGAKVEAFAKNGRDLVVVSGMPTSGLLTTQLVVLGRRSAKSEYRVVLRTAVFMGDLKIKPGNDGLTADRDGKAVLYVPFDLATIETHTGL
jgi:hypothetical protein